MKRVDIRFAKEYDKKRAEQQIALVDRLAEVLPEKIAEYFEDENVEVRVRISSSAGIEVTGFKFKEEKEEFMQFLEELWQDSSLVEEY